MYHEESHAEDLTVLYLKKYYLKLALIIFFVKIKIWQH
jgi:hypothetical protein